MPLFRCFQSLEFLLGFKHRQCIAYSIGLYLLAPFNQQPYLRFPPAMIDPPPKRQRNNGSQP